MKKHILFVDDEPNVLQGLQRMLRSQRQEWDISFAGSGSAALQVLQDNPVDVIVSDMRMPGMDGAELLAQVHDVYPQIMRIVLSGQSDQEMTMRSIGPTHQYISKPCEAEQIKKMLARAFALQNLVASDSVRAFIHGLETLPSLPGIYIKIQKEVESEDCSVKKIAELVNQDLAMTLKILQMVNSAFFGMPRSISDPAEAVTMLGIDVIKSLVLTVGVSSQFKQNLLNGISAEEHWTHSLAVGHLAKKIAQAEATDREFCEYAHVSGMLHDIGQLILLQNFPGEYAQVGEIMKTGETDIISAEKQVFNCNHAQVGAYLIGLWGLADEVVEAIAYHHRPGEFDEAVKFSPLTCVHVADAILSHAASDFEDSCIDMAHLATIGLSARLDHWTSLNMAEIKEKLQ